MCMHNCVEQWLSGLRRWSSNSGVAGSNPRAFKEFPKKFLPLSCPPSSDGYLVHESKVGSTCASAPLWQHRARGGKESAEHAYAWISDYKLVPLPLIIINLFYIAHNSQWCSRALKK